MQGDKNGEYFKVDDNKKIKHLKEEEYKKDITNLLFIESLPWGKNMNIKLNFLELYETNNWFYKYVGAMDELNERDIDCDYRYYIDELKNITEKLSIDNMFDWGEIYKLYEDNDDEYMDMLLDVENKVSEILKSTIYGVEY